MFKKDRNKKRQEEEVPAQPAHPMLENNYELKEFDMCDTLGTLWLHHSF